MSATRHTYHNGYPTAATMIEALTLTGNACSRWCCRLKRLLCATVMTLFGWGITTADDVSHPADSTTHKVTVIDAGLVHAGLNDEDYLEVAEELNIEVAAMKAVVDIEAGKAHKGFYAHGKPLINFDLTMYTKLAPRHNISLAKARKSHPVIFNRPNTARYGSYQAAQQARLDAAAEIDSVSAYESTFWGMFQIGGFNWQKCGCDSVGEFVELMRRSERDQLELFARFIQNSGMVDDIRNKNWLRFATKYNGPKARQRGYHTRLAASYRRHKTD